jgi:hypothetical protein
VRERKTRRKEEGKEKRGRKTTGNNRKETIGGG